ncbi:MAG: MraY family glycosyltransferase [Myxococcota bacterium]|nr:MraY family glycosyltransferase [Myxococcota bacterium]
MEDDGAMQAAEYVIPLVMGFAASVCATPLVARLARRFGVIDRPNERSVSQRENIPLMGGLAVAAGFAAALGYALLTVNTGVGTFHLGGLLAGGLVLLVLGIWDDRLGLGAVAKFAGQIIAAVIAISAGFQMGHITDPITHTTYFLPEPVAWVASVLWIVGVTNALNLIDGLDGLATGVGAIICATLTVILWQAGEPFGVCLGVALLGGLLGFLPFNFPPARIFLGDTGALFIGFTLALLALEGYRQVTVITFVVPLLALAVPIMDTAVSILRRAGTGQNPFRADRMHIHHRLLARRGSARGAVLQFYFLTGCFSLIAVSFTDLHGTVAGLCLVAVFVLTLRLLANLGVLSFSESDELAMRSAPAAPEEEKS